MSFYAKGCWFESAFALNGLSTPGTKEITPPRQLFEPERIKFQSLSHSRRRGGVKGQQGHVGIKPLVQSTSSACPHLVSKRALKKLTVFSTCRFNNLNMGPSSASSSQARPSVLPPLSPLRFLGANSLSKKA